MSAYYERLTVPIRWSLCGDALDAGDAHRQVEAALDKVARDGHRPTEIVVPEKFAYALFPLPPPATFTYGPHSYRGIPLRIVRSRIATFEVWVCPPPIQRPPARPLHSVAPPSRSEDWSDLGYVPSWAHPLDREP